MTTLTLCAAMLLIAVAPAIGQAMARPDFIAAVRAWDLPTDASHPRLYFSKPDIPALRQRAQADEALWKRLEGAGENDRAGLEELCLAYLMTGDTTCAERAKQKVEAIIAQPDWVYEHHKPLVVDLRVAGRIAELGTAYDYLYEYLTPEERDTIRTAILDRGVRLFLDIHSKQSEWWARSTHNWRSVICGEMGIGALAVMEDYPDARAALEEAVNGCLVVLDRGGIDGGWDEGVGYWAYGIGRALRFGLTLKNVSGGAVDLFQHPYVKVTGDFGLYTITPDGGCFDFADCHSRRPNPWLMAVLAAGTRSPHWQWYARQHFRPSVTDLAWFDPDAPTAPPTELPKAKLFRGIQIGIMRTGWEADDVFLGFKSGPTTANHSHLDINSFMLSAFGKALIIDTGSWTYAHAYGFFSTRGPRWDYDANDTIAHSTVLVNGRGQQYGEEHYGEILKLETQDAYDYLVADGAPAYGDALTKFLRYVVFLKPDCFVILDDLAAAEPSEFEALFQYAGELSAGENGLLTVTNEGAAADMLFVLPTDETGRTIAKVDRRTNYPSSSGARSPSFRYVSVSPLHKATAARIIIVLRARKADDQAPLEAKVVEESDAQVTLEVSVGDRRRSVRFDLTRGRVDLS